MRLAGLLVAAAVATACRDCPISEVVRDEKKDAAPAVLCASFEASRSTAIACELFCGTGFTSCVVDRAYREEWERTNAKALQTPGTAFACPAPIDGRSLVGVSCQEIAVHEEAAFGSGCPGD